jgi:hypothetical protein
MTPQVAINAANVTGSKYGIRNSINNHSWYGVLSTLNKDLSSLTQRNKTSLLL